MCFFMVKSSCVSLKDAKKCYMKRTGHFLLLVLNCVHVARREAFRSLNGVVQANGEPNVDDLLKLARTFFLGVTMTNVIIQMLLPPKVA